MNRLTTDVDALNELFTSGLVEVLGDVVLIAGALGMMFYFNWRLAVVSLTVVPLLIASTLLVPGYVEAEQVRQIACFIAELDPTIPYALLAFHPAFEMHDLPTTPRRQAVDCLAAAQAAGVQRVRLGNAHLLA